MILYMCSDTIQTQYTNTKLSTLLRVLAADSQPFSLYLGNKTTFCFPIKKYHTIDFLTFPISIKYYFFTLILFFLSLSYFLSLPYIN
jgi:hypothetical protein